jgi:tRNA1(Val) A37 N6-methylase TrmN6
MDDAQKKASERFLFYMQLTNVASDVIEKNKFNPPITVLCTDLTNGSKVLEVTVDMNPPGCRCQSTWMCS